MLLYTENAVVAKRAMLSNRPQPSTIDEYSVYDKITDIIKAGTSSVAKESLNFLYAWGL